MKQEISKGELWLMLKAERKVKWALLAVIIAGFTLSAIVIIKLAAQAKGIC